MNPLSTGLVNRVPALLPTAFTFIKEPMAAVRMNYNARFVEKEGSPAQVYIGWKDAIRDLFDQFDCRDHTIGVPFDEPLSMSGRFQTTENVDAKDLDNLIKAIFDAMNPSRRKNWSGLRTFLWTDDRHIKHFGSWSTVPHTEPLIEILLTPLWGRVDPNLNYIEGRHEHHLDGRRTITIVTLDYPFRVVIPSGVLQPAENEICRMWPVATSNGVHTVVAEPYQAIFYRELLLVPGVTEKAALRLLDVPWHDLLNGLITGNVRSWEWEGVSKAWIAKVLPIMRERCPNPMERLRVWAERFEPTLFEHVAELVSQRVAFPWATVRNTLKSADIDWHSDYDTLCAQATKIIEETHETAKRADKKARAKKSPKGFGRKAH